MSAAANVVLRPLREANSAPLNPLPRFEGHFKAGKERGKAKEEREKERKKRDRRERRKHPTKYISGYSLGAVQAASVCVCTWFSAHQKSASIITDLSLD